ncbi:Porin-like protein NicP precursor [compost metagenome]
MVRYIKGDDIDVNASIDDGEEWIRDIELAYTVQDGPLKALNVKWRTSSIRKNWVSNGTDFDEHGLIVNYPLNIF